MQQLCRNSGSTVTAVEKVITIALLYLAFLISYSLVNRTIPVSGSFDLTTTLDQRIPFVTAFVYPFYLAYVILPMPIFLLGNRTQLSVISVAFLAMLTLASIFFLLFPVRVPRPDAVPATLSGNIVARIYEADRPVCGFPSLHVGISFFVAFVSLKMSVCWGVVLLGFAFLTSLSVLFIKQHVVLDVIGGVVLSLAAYWGTRRFL